MEITFRVVVGGGLYVLDLKDAHSRTTLWYLRTKLYLASNYSLCGRSAVALQSQGLFLVESSDRFRFHLAFDRSLDLASTLNLLPRSVKVCVPPTQVLRREEYLR